MPATVCRPGRNRAVITPMVITPVTNSLMVSCMGSPDLHQMEGRAGRAGFPPAVFLDREHPAPVAHLGQRERLREVEPAPPGGRYDDQRRRRGGDRLVGIGGRVPG